MRARRLTAALLLALTTAACSAGPAAVPRPVPTSEAPRIDRAALRDGGTLRWAVDAVPATLNVYRPEAGADSALIAHALYPSLFRPDAHARPVADPDYLTAAESTPPGRTPQVVTYRLNPRAVWSDGTPLSVADFAAQRAALSGLDPAYASTRPAGYAAIDSITRGDGPHEVKVTFRQPYADWRGLFSPLYPAAETATAAAFGQPLTFGTHLTAGPFVLAGHDAEGGRVTLTRNPLWWGDPAKADRIEFLRTPDGWRTDALEQDRLDIAPLTAAVDRATTPEESGAALRRAESLPGVVLHRGGAPALTQLTLNGGRAPLDDPALRRAVAAAVDRRRIAEAALGPLGLPAAVPGHHLLAPDQEGYHDNSGTAGPAGERREVTLTLLLPAGSAIARRTADALTANLAEAGITVRPSEVAADAFLRERLPAGDWDLALFSWPTGPYPAGGQRAVYAKPVPGPDGTPQTGSNHARTGTDEIDRLFDRAAAELDPAKQRRLLDETDARIWQLAHSVPLHVRPELTALRAGVAGEGLWGPGWPRYQDVGFLRE
ncbi:ABC transporter family substrate-binding protein [Kitasatospora sp. NPDC004240]